MVFPIKFLFKFISDQIFSKMKQFFPLVLIAVIFLSCTNTSQQQETTADAPEISFDSLLSQYYQEKLKLDPLEATYAGDDRYNDRLPNYLTEAFQDSLRQFYTNYQGLLAAVDTTGFSEEEKISYQVLDWELDTNLEGLQFQTQLMPINQFWSLNLTIGQLAGGTSAQPFKTVQDYENWLKRLNSYSAWLDTALVNMRKGITQGYVLPKALTQKVIPQFASLTEGPIDEHLFFAPVNNMPDDFSASDKERLKKGFAEIIQEEIIPKYEEIHTFLEKEYLQASRESSGISEIPDGEEYYKYTIKLFTTTDMTADEIFELGQKEVERITKEMIKVKDEVGFKGDLKAFFDHVRTADNLTPFTKPEQVIEHFEEIHERMKPQLSKLFDMTPKTPFEVRRTEAFREASASAEYNPGSVDGSRPGVFYVPIPDVEEYNILSDEDLFLHEAIPGHHYQISLTQENQNLPDFRKTLWYSAYGEGWALYSESLGKELGLYEDPYQYFGMLSAEMHRAIRLVVDAGIHAKGWTREEAIAYSLEHEAETESGIISEIERYMSIPGQALSYKVGQLKILELRARAQEALGDKFDIKVFHNKVLESGSVPLAILEDKINRWIEEEKI